MMVWLKAIIATTWNCWIFDVSFPNSILIHHRCSSIVCTFNKHIAVIVFLEIDKIVFYFKNWILTDDVVRRHNANTIRRIQFWSGTKSSKVLSQNWKSYYPLKARYNWNHFTRWCKKKIIFSYIFIALAESWTPSDQKNL